jgi:Protein of unknown function (DUF1826)
MTMTLASRALIAGNIDVLSGIHDPDISIAIWQRTPPLQANNLLHSDLKSIRLSARPPELPLILETAMINAAYSTGIVSNMLLVDILALANRFAALMKIDAVEIRLEHVTDNACKKFHSDYVTARLITTYCGQGTQWLDGEDADNCDCGDPHNIRQMEAGDVAILKGRLWSIHAPAIHRSPPIEGTGETRLMLVINPAPVNQG